MKRIYHSLLLVALFTLALFGTALAADNVNILGYEFEFLGAVDNSDGTSTWTYAVTADGIGEPTGLSHWTLGLELNACMTIVSPTTEPYVTPTNHPYCSTAGVTCLEGVYTQVESGKDNTTGVNGIKFGDADSTQLAANNQGTHIFEITLSGVPADFLGDIPVGAKTGQGQGTGETGFITGPTCTPDPQAISLASVAAGGSDGSGIFLLGLLLLVGLSTGGAVLVRRRMPA